MGLEQIHLLTLFLLERLIFEFKTICFSLECGRPIFRRNFLASDKHSNNVRYRREYTMICL